MRVVLDTNTLLVSIGRKSKYRIIFEALLEGRIRLLLTNDILSEYVEILEARTSPIVAENIASFLLRSPDVERTEVYFRWAAIYADADDNKFVDCALNSNADFIVTDDRHYQVLTTVPFPKIRVMRTSEFAAMLGQR